MQTQRGIQGRGPHALNNHRLKPDLQHGPCASSVSCFTTSSFASLSDLGRCHLFGSVWIKTPLECVKSSSVTPEDLMGKSWHLPVNEPLYSAEHLSQDQGLKASFGLPL